MVAVELWHGSGCLRGTYKLTGSACLDMVCLTTFCQQHACKQLFTSHVILQALPVHSQGVCLFAACLLPACCRSSWQQKHGARWCEVTLCGRVVRSCGDKHLAWV